MSVNKKAITQIDAKRFRSKQAKNRPIVALTIYVD